MAKYIKVSSIVTQPGGSGVPRGSGAGDQVVPPQRWLPGHQGWEMEPRDVAISLRPPRLMGES